jgi:hypothetical protein
MSKDGLSFFFFFLVGLGFAKMGFPWNYSRLKLMLSQKKKKSAGHWWLMPIILASWQFGGFIVMVSSVTLN